MVDSRRPRVLVVGPLPPPLGGVQLMIDMQLHSSLAQEFELHVVDTSKRALRWAVEKQSWRTPFYFLRDLANLVRALAEVRPAVVYVHAASGISFTRDWVFMLVCRVAGRRVVCHFHGTLHTVFPSSQTRFGRFAGRWMMRAADRVIVLGPTYRREMGIAWQRSDLEWSPNMADVELYRSLPRGGTLPGVSAGEPVVLFVGRLSAPKGIHDLFDAIPTVLARHPEARFVLVGVAETEAREPALRAEVARRGFGERVVFLGSLDGADKARAYLAATVLVVPSWTEAFPLVIPEGMAAGLPMVVSAVGAIPDFVSDGVDGLLVPPRDPAALAAGIVRLLDDEPLRQRLAERVRERAPREFGIETGAQRVGEVMRTVIELDRGA